MAIAWAVTLPAAGVAGAAAYGISALAGGGTAGPVVVCLMLVAGLGLFARSRQAPPPIASDAS